MRILTVPGGDNRILRAALSGFAAVLLSACSAASVTNAPPLQSTAASAVASAQPSVDTMPSVGPSANESAAPEDTAQPTGLVTALDPCTLVTSGEATSLAGVPLGDGQESTTAGNGRICSYGQEGVVFEVVVSVAPDVATARSEEQSAEADLQKAAANGLMLTELTGFADGAADAATLEGSQSIGGKTFSASAIYILKGTTFVGISDIATLGAEAPTGEALQAEGLTVVGRLP